VDSDEKGRGEVGSMTDQEIEELAVEYRLANPEKTTAIMFAKEVERRTRQEFFAMLAMRTADERSITSRELDKLIWEQEQKRKATEQSDGTQNKPD
jgi:hypothetical protein